ncbi:MAG: NAD(P)H-dependent glycerol-3-phosphate dehydrogenase, partial [Bacteroidia bacterium]
MENLKRIAVIGGGSWATALMKILSENKASGKSRLSSLSWWVRSEEKAEYIRVHKHNPDYISSIAFDTEHIKISSNLLELVLEADTLLIAIPAAFLENALAALPKDIFKDKTIVSAIKGLVPSTKQIVGDYFIDHYGIAEKKILVISGPCHAEEVANEKLSYLTIAGTGTESARGFAALLNNDYIRTVVSSDVRGTEYGAVLKNIYAVAAGICHGLGYGDNFQAVLMSNSIREMKRFLRNITDTDRKINHSAYLGDLLVTGYSVHSRNRTFGNMIGKG